MPMPCPTRPPRTSGGAPTSACPTSPMSTNFKRLLSEPDPVRRAEDRAGMMAQANRGHADVRASSLAQLIKGAAMPVEPLDPGAPA